MAIRWSWPCPAPPPPRLGLLPQPPPSLPLPGALAAVPAVPEVREAACPCPAAGALRVVVAGLPSCCSWSCGPGLGPVAMACAPCRGGVFILSGSRLGRRFSSMSSCVVRLPLLEDLVVSRRALRRIIQRFSHGRHAAPNHLGRERHGLLHPPRPPPRPPPPRNRHFRPLAAELPGPAGWPRDSGPGQLREVLLLGQVTQALPVPVEGAPVGWPGQETEGQSRGMGGREVILKVLGHVDFGWPGLPL